MSKIKRKILLGKVLKAKMQKTVVVQVERTVIHPRYKKVIRKYSKFKVHDENGLAREGDRVKIMETRPLSKEKRWVILEVIKNS
ncbi:MAG: 30S ribosomal protein S17 [Candidatus Omnitrophica bacterium]|nr:30S ribosomal protein S17 [Candidatus Omnitrophota bacterium]